MRLQIGILLAASSANAFMSPSLLNQPHARQCQISRYTRYSNRGHGELSMSTGTTDEAAVVSTTEEPPMAEVEFPPILEELRDVAMKLHTREQSPREGKAEAPAKPAAPYVPTAADYLQFLVDSNAVYVALEEIVDSRDQLAPFRNTGIERTRELEMDIQWMCEKFDLDRPEVGAAGGRYADELRGMVKSDDDIPEFMCHYYNYYFAHLAGGRMIGKQMSKLLLDGETLEFYKWGEDVNELKPRVKNQIEELAKQWSRTERDKCINATAGAFRGGGAINGYLYGGSQH